MRSMDIYASSPIHLASYFLDNPCKSKIACTIGPSTSSPLMLSQLVNNGMSIARLNLSHCDHKFASEVVTNLRSHLVSIKTTTQVAVLFDLNGTKLRTGRLREESVHLTEGSSFDFILNDDAGDGDVTQVAANIPYDCVKVGDKIFVDDGSLGFTINEKIEDNLGQRLRCTVDNSGRLGEKKGINLPEYNVDDQPGLTPKDVEDIKFSVAENVDFITLSCIRSDSQVMDVRKILGNSKIKILSKIENKAGMYNFDKILRVSDGIIIDRGYLGVEIDFTKIALVQKDIIHRCQVVGKPVLLANQILESMIQFSRPSRSESSDVTSGVVDGADGLILSAETAIGQYPLESLQWVRKICYEAERHIDYFEVQQLIMRSVPKPIPVSESIACSAVKCAREVQAACIIVYTEAGGTARLLSKYRPTIPVIATTNMLITARQLGVSFGLISYFHPEYYKEEELSLRKATDFAIELGILKPGEHVVICSGSVVGFEEGTTTTMRVITA